MRVKMLVSLTTRLRRSLAAIREDPKESGRVRPLVHQPLPIRCPHWRIVAAVERQLDRRASTDVVHPQIAINDQGEPRTVGGQTRIFGETRAPSP